MVYGYIYKISTTASSKVYIGQTTKTVEERFAEHLRSSTEKAKETLHLYRAMNKYGKETFYVEQLDIAQTREELNNKTLDLLNDLVYGIIKDKIGCEVMSATQAKLCKIM